MSRPIVIIGGGLAGIASAIRLVEAGNRPVLVETRRKLGGRATSFIDPRTGDVLDNCQHVLLGCCTHLIDLYDRLGVLDRMQWHQSLYWTAGGGDIDELSPGRLPAPLHLAGAFRRLRIYSRAQKRDIARGTWRLIRAGDKGRLAWAGRPFQEFLTECGQSADVIRRFWNVIIVSACNLGVDRVDSLHAMQVFQQGFLASRWSGTMGLPTCPLWNLYESAPAMIEGGGGSVRLGISAKAIAFDGRRVTGVITDEGFIEASAVVAAVPFDRLDRLVSDSMRDADPRLRRLDRFDVSPILGIHLTFERPIMDLPHLVLVDMGVQWLFNKGIDPRTGGQHLHAVISAADEWMELTEPQITARVVEDVRRALPVSAGLEPVEARSVKEKRATFAAVAGIESHRPPAAPAYASGGGIENLFLAGDWCDTGWPATMEGAVRSGYAAAEAIAGVPMMIADVPPAWLARLLAG